MLAETAPLGLRPKRPWRQPELYTTKSASTASDANGWQGIPLFHPQLDFRRLGDIDVIAIWDGDVAPFPTFENDRATHVRRLFPSRFCDRHALVHAGLRPISPDVRRSSAPKPPRPRFATLGARRRIPRRLVSDSPPRRLQTVRYPERGREPCTHGISRTWRQTLYAHPRPPMATHGHGHRREKPRGAPRTPLPLNQRERRC